MPDAGSTNGAGAAAPAASSPGDWSGLPVAAAGTGAAVAASAPATAATTAAAPGAGGSAGCVSSSTLPFRSRTRSTRSGGVLKPRAAIDA